MKKLDVLTPKKWTTKDGEERTFWLRIGSAFPTRGGGTTVQLDALPLPDKEGRCTLLIAEQRERDASKGGGSERTRNDAQDPGSDDIPF